MKQLIGFLILISAMNVFAGLEVVRVLPNKINYKLNEDAVISVTVANRGDAKENAELVLLDKWDLDQEKVISKMSVELEGQSEKTFRIPWNTGSIRYGHESRAILMKDSKEISAKSEFFNVINEWWRVNIGVWPSVIGGTEQGDRLCKWYGLKPYNTPFDRFYYKSWGNSPIGPFASYFTNFTPWNMSFSTFGGFYDPSYKDDERWWATAEGAEPRTYNDFKKEAAFAKKWGVHRTKYLSGTITGYVGFELLRKHPQWGLKDTKGDFDYHEPVDPLGLNDREKPYFAGWTHVYPDFNQPGVMKFGIDTVLDSVKRYGFNGVYFDGLYKIFSGYNHEGQYSYNIPNRNTINKKLQKYAVQRFNEFRKTNPDFYHWVNGVPSLRNPSGVKSIWSSTASGALWECGVMPLNPAIDYMNNISSFNESAAQIRNAISDSFRTPHEFDIKTNILHMGYTSFPDGLWMFGPRPVASFRKGLRFQNFEKSHQFWAVNSHMAAIMASVCAHPYALQGAAYRPFTQIMTRYSDFYWNEDIRILKKAFRKFDVDALRDIWWEDFVYIKETPGYTDYYIHLHNAPDVKTFSYATIEETMPAKDVELCTRLFKDPKKVQAWAIQPYGSTGDVLEPVVSKIKPEIVEDETVFCIPDFRYYTLVVIREKK